MSRLVALLMLLALALVACGNLTPSTTTTTQPAATTVAPSQPLLPPVVAPLPTAAVVEPALGGAMPKDLTIIKNGVQKTVDKFLEAMNKSDEQALAQIVDQENLSFKRATNNILTSRYNTWKGVSPKGTVSKVQIIKEPYIRAWLNDSVRGNHVWLFKWTEQGWLLSEPDEEELGAKKNKETEQFTLRYFEWDEPWVDEVVKNIQFAFDTVKQYTGRTTQQKFLVRMAPTFQTLTGRMDVGTRASYSSALKMTSISAPESFHSTFFGGNISELGVDLQHEFTHMLVDDALAPRGTLWWVNEAFAHYFSKDLRADLVRSSLNKKIFTLKELQQLENSDVTDRQTDLEMRAQGTVAVQYMAEKLGTREKAWEWLRAEAEARDFNQSLQKVFGVNAAQFEKGWQEFMRQNYK